MSMSMSMSMSTIAPSSLVSLEPLIPHPSSLISLMPALRCLSPCLHVSMSPCPPCLHVSMSPCVHVSSFFMSICRCCIVASNGLILILKGSSDVTVGVRKPVCLPACLPACCLVTCHLPLPLPLYSHPQPLNEVSWTIM
jgi:hypothetical protein